MKHTAIITALILFAAFAAQGVIVNPMDYKDTEKAYNDYVEFLKQHDVYITLPQNYSPTNIRGLSYVKESIGRGEEFLNIDCNPIDIGAIVEEDSCRVAICYPQMIANFPDSPFYLWDVHGSKRIESDLRMIHEDMHLDVRPLINIIVEEDMSQYANADTVATYEFDLKHRAFMENYTRGMGIYLRKKNHPSMLIRLMFTYNSYKDKDKYIREALDNIRFGDNPSETFVELEKKESGRSDFTFPTKYRMFTGILPDINDETLEEINRVKAWCEEHGMKELPKLDDAVLDALNKSKESRKYIFDLPKIKPLTDNNQPASKPIAKEPQVPEYIYDMKGVPVAPKFNGGSEGLSKWIQDNIQYPANAAKTKIEGRVIVEFIIDKNGAVTAPKVVRGINDSLNNEALRVIKSMPRWTPGYSKGKPVKTRYTYPVVFKLTKAK